MFYVERFKGDNKMFDNKENYIFLGLNWIFGLLFLVAGIDAFFDTKAGGLSFIIISLLLLPPVRVKVFSLTQKEIKMGTRSLYISLLFISFVFFIATGNERPALDLKAQSTVTANSIKQDHENTNSFANNSTGIQIKSNKKVNLSEKSVQMQSPDKQQPLHLETQSTLPANSIRQDHESTNSFANSSTGIQIKSNNKDNLPEKSAQMQSPDTEQANQINNNKSDSEIKSNDILAKLKDIPVSQYELNRSLYKQLVNFNPSEDKYKKKLSFYSQKIKQQSCNNIGTNKTFDYSPNWLSANGHCLSENQKKKMEIALFEKVKKISSKKVLQNWEGYKSLSILNPDNKSYLNKLEHYKNKLEVRTANS